MVPREDPLQLGRDLLVRRRAIELPQRAERRARAPEPLLEQLDSLQQQRPRLGRAGLGPLLEHPGQLRPALARAVGVLQLLEGLGSQRTAPQLASDRVDADRVRQRPVAHVLTTELDRRRGPLGVVLAQLQLAAQDREQELVVVDRDRERLQLRPSLAVVGVDLDGLLVGRDRPLRVHEPHGAQLGRPTQHPAAAGLVVDGPRQALGRVGQLLPPTELLGHPGVHPEGVCVSGAGLGRGLSQLQRALQDRALAGRVLLLVVEDLAHRASLDRQRAPTLGVVDELQLALDRLDQARLVVQGPERADQAHDRSPVVGDLAQDEPIRVGGPLGIAERLLVDAGHFAPGRDPVRRRGRQLGHRLQHRGQRWVRVQLARDLGQAQEGVERASVELQRRSVRGVCGLVVAMPPPGFARPRSGAT